MRSRCRPASPAIRRTRWAPPSSCTKRAAPSTKRAPAAATASRTQPRRELVGHGLRPAATGMREQRVDEHDPSHAFEVNRDTRQVRTRATVPYDDDRWREVDVVDALDRDARATGAQLAGHPRPRERSRERAR